MDKTLKESLKRFHRKLIIVKVLIIIKFNAGNFSIGKGKIHEILAKILLIYGRRNYQKHIR